MQLLVCGSAVWQSTFCVIWWSRVLSAWACAARSLDAPSCLRFVSKILLNNVIKMNRRVFLLEHPLFFCFLNERKPFESRLCMTHIVNTVHPFPALTYSTGEYIVSQCYLVMIQRHPHGCSSQFVSSKHLSVSQCVGLMLADIEYSAQINIWVHFVTPGLYCSIIDKTVCLCVFNFCNQKAFLALLRSANWIYSLNNTLGAKVSGDFSAILNQTVRSFLIYN